MPITLWNLKENKEEGVDEKKASELIRSGDYTIIENEPLTVYDGVNRKAVSNQELYDALLNGQQVLTQDEIKRKEAEDEWGGAGGAAASAALGAARGATFGISDQILTKAGLVEPETLKQIDEVQEGAGLAGEIAGTVGSLLLPGAGLVGGAAKAGKAVSKGTAKALGKKTAKELLEEGIERAPKNIAQRISDVAPEALGSAVEGAFYGTGQVLTEEAMGNIDLTAESIVTEALPTILTAGILGGALPVAAQIPKALKDQIVKANKQTSVAKGLMEKAIKGYSKVQEIANDIPAEGIQEVMKLTPKAARLRQKILRPQEMRESINNAVDGIIGAEKNLVPLVRQFNTNAKSVRNTLFKEADTMAEGVNMARRAIADSTPMLQRLKAINDELKVNKELYPANVRTKFNKHLSDLETAIDVQRAGLSEPGNGLDLDVASDIFDAVLKFRRGIEKDIKYGKFPTAQEMDAQKLLQDARESIVRPYLENQYIWGEIGKGYATYNKAINDFMDAEKRLLEKFGKTDLIDGKRVRQLDRKKMEKAMYELSNPNRTKDKEALTDYINALSAIDSVGNEWPNYIAADSLAKFNSLSNKAKEQLKPLGMDNPLEFNRLMETITANNQAKAIKSTGLDISLPTMVGFGVGGWTGGAVGLLGSAAMKALRDPRNTVKAMAFVEEKLRRVQTFSKGLPSVRIKGIAAGRKQLTSDVVADMIVDTNNGKLDEMQSKLDEELIGLSMMLPETAKALKAKSAAAIEFLKSKVPTPPPEANTLFYGEWKPNSKEIREFREYYLTAIDPQGAIEQVYTNGIVTPQVVETLQVLYPALYNQVVTDTMDNYELIAKEPYKNKLAISQFIGQVPPYFNPGSGEQGDQMSPDENLSMAENAQSQMDKLQGR